MTRWREDATCDDWGSYVFLRDVASGEVWSATYQPIGTEPDAYEVTFNEDRAEFTRRTATWRPPSRCWSRPRTMRKCAA